MTAVCPLYNLLWPLKTMKKDMEQMKPCGGT